jgi:hypothetical protein
MRASANLTRTSFIVLVAMMLGICCADTAPKNLVTNPDLQATPDRTKPAGYDLTGDAEYRYLGDPARDMSQWGVALESSGSAGAVSQTISGIHPADGRWYRFTFRGLPQDGFAVGEDDLYMKVEFFGEGGRTFLDGKEKKLYPLVEQERRNFTINGDRHVGGAAVWRTYQLDFWLPFPQVDQLRISVGFGHGAGRGKINSEFFVSDLNVVRLTDLPAEQVNWSSTRPDSAAKSQDASVQPQGTLIPIGGRWYYDAPSGQTSVPKLFDYTNAQRLLYHEAKWEAPFVGNTSAWLRAGDKDFAGNVVGQDQFIADNVTIEFDSTSMIVHTRGLPNHPTGRFPENIDGRLGNPSYIQEHRKTYFIPLDPRVNARHIFTARDNSNHALPMGPIGVALNGVVFFNPFDANSQDASNMMDRCCGHPAPDNTYHYHKYPICENSPWADEGKEHSPLIGFAFDGFPIYGPYESANVMAKDVTGENALNDFNLHFDKDRGWHYHVTPGKFPYIIGGYWGTEDARDKMRGPPGGMRGGPGGQNGPGGGPGGGMGGPGGQGGGGPPGGGPGGNDDLPPPPPPF